MSEEQPDISEMDWNTLRSFASEKDVQVKGRTREEIESDLQELRRAEETNEDLAGGDEEKEKTISMSRAEEDEEDPADDGDEVEEADESEEEQPAPAGGVGEEQTVNLEKHLSGSSSSSSSSDEDSQDRKGLDEAVNAAWGRLWTMDLPPEGKHKGQDVSNIRKNLQGLAHDIGLGQNAKWYYEEEIKGQTDDPKKAVFGSLFMAVLLTAPMRPDLVEKVKDSFVNDEGTAQGDGS